MFSFIPCIPATVSASAGVRAKMDANNIMLCYVCVVEEFDLEHCAAVEGLSNSHRSPTISNTNNHSNTIHIHKMETRGEENNVREKHHRPAHRGVRSAGAAAATNIHFSQQNNNNIQEKQAIYSGDCCRCRGVRGAAV